MTKDRTKFGVCVKKKRKLWPYLDWIHCWPSTWSICTLQFSKWVD